MFGAIVSVVEHAGEGDGVGEWVGVEGDGVGELVSGV